MNLGQLTVMHWTGINAVLTSNVKVGAVRVGNSDAVLRHALVLALVRLQAVSYLQRSYTTMSTTNVDAGHYRTPTHDLCLVGQK